MGLYSMDIDIKSLLKQHVRSVPDIYFLKPLNLYSTRAGDTREKLFFFCIGYCFFPKVCVELLLSMATGVYRTHTCAFCALSNLCKLNLLGYKGFARK
jgi:hypothetical protein